MTRRNRNSAPVIARALVVYYATERYGPTHQITLCDLHRAPFYSQHPCAYGIGEWRPLEDCEYCRRTELALDTLLAI